MDPSTAMWWVARRRSQPSPASSMCRRACPASCCWRARQASARRHSGRVASSWRRTLIPRALVPAVRVGTQLSFVALGDLLADAVDEVLPALPGPQAKALEVALLLGEADGSPPHQRAIALAFLGALRVLARAGPVAVAVDDIQWLDRSSAFVLEFALRRLGEDALAFLLALRDEGATSLPLDLERALTGERLRRLRVGPLSLGAVHRLVNERLDLVLTRARLRRLRELSAGNPLFALELGRAVGRGAIRLEPGEPLPGSLATLVGDRLAVLPADTRAALVAAAPPRSPRSSSWGARPVDARKSGWRRRSRRCHRARWGITSAFHIRCSRPAHTPRPAAAIAGHFTGVWPSCCPSRRSARATSRSAPRARMPASPMCSRPRPTGLIAWRTGRRSRAVRACPPADPSGAGGPGHRRTSRPPARVGGRRQRSSPGAAGRSPRHRVARPRPAAARSCSGWGRSRSTKATGGGGPALPRASSESGNDITLRAMIEEGSRAHCF